MIDSSWPAGRVSGDADDAAHDRGQHRLDRRPRDARHTLRPYHGHEISSATTPPRTGDAPTLPQEPGPLRP